MDAFVAGLLISFSVIVLWAVSDLIAKKVIDKIGSRRALFYTQGISALIYFALLPFFWGKGPFGFSPNFWILSILSGAGNAAAWIFYFKALEGGKLSIAQPITYLWPFVTIALSIPFLGEKVGFSFLLGALLAAASIYLIAFPKNRVSIGRDAKWGLFAMAFWGFAMFLTKPIVTEAGSFYPVLITRIVFFSIFLPYAKLFPEREGKVRLPFGRMFLVGAFNSASFLLYNLAVETAGSSLPALVSAVSPAVVAALSFLFLSEKISARQLVGIALAVLGLGAVSLF